MMIDDAIELVTRSLEVVYLESAAARVADTQWRNSAKECAAALTDASPSEVMRCAVHESGHAIAATCGGLHVERACVRADGTGSCDYRVTDESQTIERIVADLGGVAAELLLGADEERQFALAHSQDILLARIHIEELRAQRPDQELTAATCAKLACCTIASNMRAIDRVARVLFALGEADGAIIAALARP